MTANMALCENYKKTSFFKTLYCHLLENCYNKHKYAMATMCMYCAPLLKCMWEPCLKKCYYNKYLSDKKE